MKKIFVVILIVMILCIGCSKPVHMNIIEENNSGIPQNRDNSNIAAIVPVNTVIEDTATNSTEDTVSQDSNIPQLYIDFVKQQQDYNENDAIMFYTKEDIDLDGIEDIIIASGVPSEEPTESYISQIYILHDNNGRIEQLGDNLKGNGYSVYEVKLIKLQNKQKKYIYCGLTNSVNLLGFKIVELTNAQPKDICYSASATGAGEDNIKDFDNDGQIDGYVQNRWSYDVLYYQTSRTYKLVDNDFLLDGAYVEIPEYPNNIQEVINQYLSLRALNEEKSKQVKERLSELCSFDKADGFDFINDPWNSAIRNFIIIPDDKFKINIAEKGSEGQVNVSFVYENKEFIRCFHVVRADNKWTIDNIE